MDRRHFLLGAASLLVAAERPRTLILVTEEEARRMRDAARRGGAPVLEKTVAGALKAGPWSVTFHRPAGGLTEAGPNDYFSEGPYWWPDPAHPGGPYIRKDGQRNPDRFTPNRNDLGAMCQATLALGMGAYLLGKTQCLERAAKILSVWFLDPKTRMNPHLEYGQAIRGVSTGRGIGIIDTVSLIHAVQGIVLLEVAGGFDPGVAAGLRRWYADYLKWLTTSTKGLDEKMAANNHATWWTAQVAAFAWLVDDSAARRMAAEHFRRHLTGQIRPDGSCPREEARTRSLSYSTMNLDGFSVICRLAQLDGVDLWKGIENCFYYLMPYVLRPDTWRKEQISPYDSSGSVFLGLAALGLRSKELLAAYQRLPRAESAWVQFVDLLVRRAETG